MDHRENKGKLEKMVKDLRQTCIMLMDVSPRLRAKATRLEAVLREFEEEFGMPAPVSVNIVLM